MVILYVCMYQFYLKNCYILYRGCVVGYDAAKFCLYALGLLVEYGVF